MFECTKEEGSIVIDGLDVDTALDARRAIEREFDALVTLTVTTGDHTAIHVRGAGDEPLDDSETAEAYRMWLSGWLVGRKEW